MIETTHFYLVAVEGRLTRDPVTKVPLSEKPQRKPRNQFYMRRVRSGDAKIVTKEPRNDG